MRRLTPDGGNVAIIVALMATVLLGVGALAVDAGAMFVRQSQLQSGADAAALAIARECAEFVVEDMPWQCNLTQATGTANEYFTANLLGDLPDVGQPDLDTQYDGRTGIVTVTAGTVETTAFAWALGTDEVRVEAAATARWGPLTAVDAVFPLAVCKGALPEPGQEVILWSSPSGGEMLGACDGAPTALPMGWLTPTDPDPCTTNVTLLPSTYMDVAPSDTEPPGEGCATAIDELLADLQVGEFCHWWWWRGWHCHDSLAPAEERTRVLAVYDAARSSGGRHPSFSLIAFEFTGARLGDAEQHMDDDWEGICDPDDDTYDTEELQCIRGRVQNYIPPDDGPIVDLSQIGLAGIEDTTVLDIRLVD